jgi:predicted cupin superfamily sugar epimerase
MSMSPTEIIRALGLAPHPEGGHFCETFRARELPFELPERGKRSASTAIYFLLAGDDFSAFHRVRSDEVWHHYLGASLELHTLEGATGHRVTRLGSRLDQGERPQHVVVANAYQAARLAEPERLDDGRLPFALCGCTVAPGFDFEDFELSPRAALEALFPEAREIIHSLTRTHLPA